MRKVTTAPASSQGRIEVLNSVQMFIGALLHAGSHNEGALRNSRLAVSGSATSLGLGLWRRAEGAAFQIVIALTIFVWSFWRGIARPAVGRRRQVHTQLRTERRLRRRTARNCWHPL